MSVGETNKTPYGGDGLIKRVLLSGGLNLAEAVRDRIEQLERERDGLDILALKYIDLLRQSEAKLAKAVEALLPFADQAYTFDSDGKEFVPGEFMPAIVTHNIGNLRYARTVLAELEVKE